MSQINPIAPVDSTPVRYGFLKVISNLDKAYLIVNEDFVNAKTITPNTAIQLPVGDHSFILSHPKIMDPQFRLEILPDQVREYKIDLDTTTSSEIVLRNSVYPVIKLKANLVVITDNDSEVFFDSTLAGTGLAKGSLSTGLHFIQTEHPLAGTRWENVRVSSRRLKVLELYNKPERSTYWALSFIPGVSRIYADRSSKGYLLLGAAFGTLTGGLLSHTAFKKSNADYQNVVYQYNRATVESEVVRLANEAQSKLDNATTYALIRDAAFIGAVVVWVLSFVDLMHGPDGGYRERRAFDPFSYVPLTPREQAVVLKIKIPLSR
ncbi:MAG: hypothetical protein HYY49_05430 [Ignavibacteriales bacterium]|nr:hypothetical protein [Ignavibacteriales bacterium]